MSLYVDTGIWGNVLLLFLQNSGISTDESAKREKKTYVSNIDVFTALGTSTYGLSLSAFARASSGKAAGLPEEIQEPGLDIRDIQRWRQ